jgi:hypothetical protein
MPVNTGTFAAFLTPDLWRVYVETGRERPLEYPLFHNVEDMPWNGVTDRQIAGLATLDSMGEGDQFPLDEPINGNTVTYDAEIFGKAVEITFPMWRDDQYGVIRELTAELARSSRNKQEVEAWSVLNNAFDNAFPGFDGVSLCNTAHPRLGGGTSANRPSPDVGLSTLAIQNAVIRFYNMVDERGLPRLFAPTQVLVAPDNVFLAREILGSSGKPFTADNEQNSLLSEGLRWMVVQYFTSASQWFVSAAQGQHDIQFLWRDRPIFDVFDDPWSKNAVATVYQRHTKGFGSWRGIDGSRP